MAGTVRDLVLLGAGLTHLEVLRRFALRPAPGLRLTLLTPQPEQPHPAKLAALLRGEASTAEACIDLGPLAVAAGARLILAEPQGIVPDERLLSLAGRPNLRFDLLSIDLEGEAVVPGGSATGLSLKPLSSFLSRLAALEATLPDSACLAVVGSDAIAPELALALAQRYAGRLRLVLVSGAEPLGAAPAAARRAVRAALVEAKVELASGVQAMTLEGGRLALSDGSYLAADAALWTDAPGPPPLLAASGLACDEAGRALVDPAGRSLSHPQVFAAGECAAAPPASAIRAAWALAAALRRAGRRHPRIHVPLQRWRPLPSTLDLGAGRAVAWYDAVAATGPAVARLKQSLDRALLRRYALRPARPGADPLFSPLPAVPRAAAPDSPVGLGMPTQAAVLTPPAGQALVQNVACLHGNWLDDPFAFGQVAAAHALSELHAIGARPWTALPIISVSNDVARRGELRDMLAGAATVLEADGCTLLAGQSGTGIQTSFGFAVSGLTDPARLPRRTRLRPGDALVLTKPLGTGVLLAGQAVGTARAAWLAAAFAVMRSSNASAGRILRLHGAGACTAVNGFGLSGHLEQMLHATEAGAVLWAAALPVLPGALELLAPQGLGALLADPQISGGLLAGVPAGRAETCLAALHDAGVQAAIVGVVEAAEPDAPAIRVTMA